MRAIELHHLITPWGWVHDFIIAVAYSPERGKTRMNANGARTACVRPSASRKIRCRIHEPRYLGIGLLLILISAGGGRSGIAASVAAKNKQGNQMYSQGRFQDAEKAYLDAQLDAPGRSELLYNLGNTLIRQKKYDQAIQSLRQAVSRGERGLQGSGWYNLGNALFESGRYQDAAQAYIQALKINPADRDAKHNLEMAWKKLQAQKQNSSGKDGQKDTQSDQGQQQNRNDSNRKDQNSAGEKQAGPDQKQAVQPEPSQVERREESISKERALQILDAMKNQELIDQRKLREKQAIRKTTGKDW